MQKSLVSVAIPVDVRYRVYRHVAFLGVLLLGITMYFGFSQKVSEKTSQTQVVSVKQVDATIQAVNLNSANGLVPTPFVHFCDVSLGSVIVNYDCPIEELVKSGEYIDVNGRVTSENFPLLQKVRSGKVSINLHLISFDCDVRGNEAINWMKGNGYRPATLAEIISVKNLRLEFAGNEDIIVPLGYLSPKLCAPIIMRDSPGESLAICLGNASPEDTLYCGDVHFAVVPIN